jgi:hypothetical protein
MNLLSCAKAYLTIHHLVGSSVAIAAQIEKGGKIRFNLITRNGSTGSTRGERGRKESCCHT